MTRSRDGVQVRDDRNIGCRGIWRVPRERLADARVGVWGREAVALMSRWGTLPGG